MRTIPVILVVFCAVFVLLPFGDIADDGAFNYSTVKLATEKLAEADDAFVDDLGRLGLISEALTQGFTSGKEVYVYYATRNEWDNSYEGFVSEDGYASYILVVRTDAEDEVQIRYPTSFHIETDSYDEYRKYVKNTYAPIDAFLKSYNAFLDSDNLVEDIANGIAMVVTALYAIIYILVVFIFDSINVLWQLLLFILRIIGIVPTIEAFTGL